MKVAELQGAVLDLWVARAEGKCYTQSPGVWGNALVNTLGRLSISKTSWNCARYFEPSSNWTHGGPIVERERIGVEYLGSSAWRAIVTNENGCDMVESGEQYRLARHGGTALEAAMRAYVASKFGDNVPDESTN
ncbi:DUF2591 family protein [Paraburkholderia sp. FT54]|uniref:phage protein NinX family protein n=1 Tax=Paraburkholderia sp. FT54 TaxID=3074437 RepID=UPI0028775E43|nr:phage protein NinX family protein [Paraburkholderia sp. FT54]WNC90941.1 DUF2591 family protein [Paraburkholderia sp. FT54]